MGEHNHIPIYLHSIYILSKIFIVIIINRAVTIRDDIDTLFIFSLFISFV